MQPPSLPPTPAPTPPEVSVRPATPADHPVLERLWLMFRHDMADVDGRLPLPDGTYHGDRLAVALGGDPDWAPYLLASGERPVGLAFVRGLTGPVNVLNSFFVVRGARRAGHGLRAVQDVVARHAGRWEVAFQEQNAKAVCFWRRVAGEIAGTSWNEERRPVPGRPELPPDVWISFDAPAGAGARGHDTAGNGPARPPV